VFGYGWFVQHSCFPVFGGAEHRRVTKKRNQWTMDRL
jgi:hypothetical protein